MKAITNHSSRSTQPRPTKIQIETASALSVRQFLPGSRVTTEGLIEAQVTITLSPHDWGDVVRAAIENEASIDQVVHYVLHGNLILDMCDGGYLNGDRKEE